MDYFALSPASVPHSSSSGSSGSSGRGHGLPGQKPTQLEQEHTIISLGDELDKDPTPVSTPLDHPGSLSISTAFHPALSIDDTDPDVVLVSADGVHFYAHQHRLLAVSMNHMGNLLPSPGAVTTPPLLTVHVPHPAEVVNVVLHTMYGLSCAQYLPTLEVVEAAVDSLSLLYGVSVASLAVPGAPLFQLILSYAPFRPLDAYALAAHYELEDLAVTISSHLLAYNLARLPDSTAQRMGPIYLKRLFLLHQSRVAALRTILFKPPAAHLPVLGCGEESQRMLTRAWALAVAQLVWDVLPNVSTSALQALLEPIGASMSCMLCVAALQRRVQEVVYEWSAVKNNLTAVSI